MAEDSIDFEDSFLRGFVLFVRGSFYDGFGSVYEICSYVHSVVGISLEVLQDEMSHFPW